MQLSPLRSTLQGAAALGLVLGLSACVATGPEPGTMTHDGLEAVASKGFDEVYRKPGVDISQYQALGISECTVSFRNHWLRDQNRDRLNLSSRVTQEDVDRIKDRLGESCEKHFREALAKAPAYNVVEEFADGEPVLVVRPSIIDLDVNAPDVREASMSRTYTTSAGEMTLVLELFDATTGEVLARAVDRQRDPDSGRLEWSSSVTNSAEANRQLTRWARQLRGALDELQGRM